MRVERVPSVGGVEDSKAATSTETKDPNVTFIEGSPRRTARPNTLPSITLASSQPDLQIRWEWRVCKECRWGLSMCDSTNKNTRVAN